LAALIPGPHDAAPPDSRPKQCYRPPTPLNDRGPVTILSFSQAHAEIACETVSRPVPSRRPGHVRLHLQLLSLPNCQRTVEPRRPGWNANAVLPGARNRLLLERFAAF